MSANLGARIGFYPGQKVGRVFYEDPEDCEFFLKQRFLEDFHENFLAKLLYAVLDFGSFLWLI